MPVVSLLDMLEIEESKTKRATDLKMVSPKRKMGSGTSTPPDTAFQGATNHIKTIRRKSCECWECGGISNLEVRTLHINCDIPSMNHRASLKELKELNPHLRINILSDQKRNSGLGHRLGGSKSNYRSIRTLTNQRQTILSFLTSPKLSQHKRTPSDKGQYGELNDLESPVKSINTSAFGTATNLEDYSGFKSPIRSRKNTGTDRGSQPGSMKFHEFEEEQKSPQSASTFSKFLHEGLSPKLQEWKTNESPQRRSDSKKITAKKRTQKLHTFDESKINCLTQGLDFTSHGTEKDHIDEKPVGVDDNNPSKAHSPGKIDLKGTALFEITQENHEESPKLPKKRLFSHSPDSGTLIKPIPTEKSFQAETDNAPNDFITTVDSQRSEKIILHRYHLQANIGQNDSSSPMSITIMHPRAKVNPQNAFVTPQRVKRTLSPSYQFSGSTIDTQSRYAAHLTATRDKAQKSAFEYIKSRRIESSPEQRILRTYTSSSFFMKRKQEFPSLDDNSKEVEIRSPKNVSLEKLQKKRHDSEKKLELLLKTRNEREIQKKRYNLSMTGHETQVPSRNSKITTNYEDCSSVEFSGKRIQTSNTEFTYDGIKTPSNQNLRLTSARSNIAQTVAAYKSLARAGNANVLNKMFSTSMYTKLERIDG